MNTRRVAALLRELADELERDDAAPANDTPKPKRRRAPQRVPSPAPEASELDIERARAAARRAGILVR